MEKVTFTYELSESAKKAKEKLVAQLLKDPYIIQFMKDYHVDEHFVQEHSGKLKDYCDVLQKCASCKGLDFCRQPKRGQRLILHLDRFLMNELHDCAYHKKEIELKKHKQQFVEADMAESYFTVDLPSLHVEHESTNYKSVYTKATNLILGKSEKGIYFAGKPGAGKTYLAAGIANFYAKQGKRIAFVNVPKLIAELKMMFQDSDAMEQKLKRIQKADVLVLDDIGGESVTAWSRDDILLPLLDARMEKRRLTLFTSNYSMEELKQRLSLTSNKMSEPVAAERLFERMRTLSDEIFIKGDSRRK